MKAYSTYSLFSSENGWMFECSCGERGMIKPSSFEYCLTFMRQHQEHYHPDLLFAEVEHCAVEHCLNFLDSDEMTAVDGVMYCPEHGGPPLLDTLTLGDRDEGTRRFALAHIAEWIAEKLKNPHGY